MEWGLLAPWARSLKDAIARQLWLPDGVNYLSEQEVSSLPIIAITRRDSWTILPEEIKAIIINHIGSKHSKDVSSIDKETWHIFDCYTHHIKLSQGAFYTLDFFHRFKNLISLNFGQNRQLSDESLKLLPNLRRLEMRLNRQLSDESLKLLTNLHTLVLGLNERISDKAFKLITNLLN